MRKFFFWQHLDDQENIILVVHKHWFLGLKSLFWPTLIFISIWSILYLSPNRYMAYGISLTEIFVLLWWLRNFLDYYLDAWLITSKGIIDLEWHGWFHRSSARVLYSDLQGVSYEVNGIFGTLMKYGHMDIEKISTGTTMGMDYVPRPRSVEIVILECMEAYMMKKNLKDSKTVQGILADFVAGTLQKQHAEELSASKVLKKVSPKK